MKKLFFAAAAALLLTGCSAGVKTDGSDILLDSVGVRVDLPDGWKIITGSAVYDEAASSSGEYESGSEMKKACEKAGQRYLAIGKTVEGDVVCTVSQQDLTIDVDGNKIDPTDAGELARSTHDSLVFDCFLIGLRTGSDSVFEELSLGGNNAWLSHFEAFYSEEDGGEMVFGTTEYTIENGTDVYFVQVTYLSEEARAQAEQIVLSAE